MRGGLLTASKSELLEDGSDWRLRAVLHNYFAFACNLEEAREKFATYIGLSPTQYMILIAVAHAPQTEPAGISQIAETVHLSGAFVTIEVNKLVADGLVVKSAHPTDGRRVQLSVTQEGLDRLSRLAAFQRPVNDALFGMLSRAEFLTLSGLLAKLASHGDIAVKLANQIEVAMKIAETQKALAKSVAIGKRAKTSRTRAR